jgi:hypothetical protein
LTTRDPVNAQSCNMTLSRELWTLNVPLYSMNPLRKRFMKKLARERLAPTISAGGFLAYFGSWMSARI